MIKPHKPICWWCRHAVIIKISSSFFFVFIIISIVVVGVPLLIRTGNIFLLICDEPKGKRPIDLSCFEKENGRQQYVHRTYFNFFVSIVDIVCMRVWFCSDCSSKLFFSWMWSTVIQEMRKQLEVPIWFLSSISKMRETLVVKQLYCLLVRGKLAGGILRFVYSLILQFDT